MRWPLAVLLAMLLLPAMPAGAAVDPIQPGDQVNGSCTLNFVYDGIGSNAGKVYIGTAAHCYTAVGQSASTAGSPNFGTVVYMGDYGGVNTGTFENGIPGEQLDFALVEVKPAFVGSVRADVLGYATTPTGSTRSTETALGDVIHASGYGMALSTLRATRENRTGLLWSDTPREWTGVAPIIFGDSGGPVLHANGKALGIVSGTSVGVIVPPVQMTGPTVEGILAESAAMGFPIALRTV